MLADVNPLAERAARQTIRHNGLEEDLVTFYLSDGLGSIGVNELNSWDVRAFVAVRYHCHNAM